MPAFPCVSVTMTCQISVKEMNQRIINAFGNEPLKYGGGVTARMGPCSEFLYGGRGLS